ncbi:MAG: hypothetical protein ACN6P1_05390 [Pseudomonas sp.]|uniref:hypothetical protein n=1 Tax=Pseudomonas sp. TaxID=306 RepID=UPI003D100E0A
MTALGLATVWIWFCLGSVGWSFFVVLQCFGIEDKAADWVQAIGSIVAILAAGYFPIRHFELAKQKREQSLLELLRVLGSQASSPIWLLTNSFLTPEYEELHMREYVHGHYIKDFEPLLAALDQIPVAELPPERVIDLARIRSAVQFAEGVAAQMPSWLKAGSSNPAALGTLRLKRDLLDTTVDALPSVSGLPNVDNPARLLGQSGERFLEPFLYWDCKIYRQYYWHDGQEVPQMVRVQITKPDAAEHPHTYEINALGPEGWDNFEEAERNVRISAEGIIRAWRMYGSRVQR